MFSDDMKFLQKAIVHHPTQDKFLALKRSPNDKARPNSWDLPRGNVLFGQTHLESLNREIEEETKLKVKKIVPIQVITNFVNVVYHLFIVYSCKATSSKVKISEEHSEFKWVSKEEFLRLESADFLMDLVKQLN